MAAFDEPFWLLLQPLRILLLLASHY